MTRFRKVVSGNEFTATTGKGGKLGRRPRIRVPLLLSIIEPEGAQGCPSPTICGAI